MAPLSKTNSIVSSWFVYVKMAPTCLAANVCLSILPKDDAVWLKTICNVL